MTVALAATLALLVAACGLVLRATRGTARNLTLGLLVLAAATTVLTSRTTRQQLTELRDARDWLCKNSASDLESIAWDLQSDDARVREDAWNGFDLRAASQLRREMTVCLGGDEALDCEEAVRAVRERGAADDQGRVAKLLEKIANAIETRHGACSEFADQIGETR